MAGDSQFGAYRALDDAPRFQIEEPDRPKRPRSWGQTCLIGCLSALVVVVLLAVIAGVWVSRHWRGWFAGVGAQVVNQGIESSDLPPQEKAEVQEQVERVAKAFRDGKISNKQAAAVVKKVVESPLMPALAVTTVDRTYFDRSALRDQEKADGRKTLHRFARGVFDGKIDDHGLDAVLAHVADRSQDGRWELRSKVSDDDLRAALSEAKTQADAAAIPEAPPKIDPSDEVKRIIDESLHVDAEVPQN